MMRSTGLADQRADGQVRHVVVVHDVEVDDIRAGSQYIVDFLAEPGEVGGQDGRGDTVSHGSLLDQLN
jgi:hypothetical protein